jgi:hypothetical protein
MLAVPPGRTSESNQRPLETNVESIEVTVTVPAVANDVAQKTIPAAITG